MTVLDFLIKAGNDYGYKFQQGIMLLDVLAKKGLAKIEVTESPESRKKSSLVIKALRDPEILEIPLTEYECRLEMLEAFIKKCQQKECSSALDLMSEIKRITKSIDRDLQESIMSPVVFSHMKRLDRFLKVYSHMLDGELDIPDCYLLPILHRIMVAEKFHKGHGIPFEFRYLNFYLQNAYENSPIFRASCPSNKNIIGCSRFKACSTSKLQPADVDEVGSSFSSLLLSDEDYLSKESHSSTQTGRGDEVGATGGYEGMQTRSRQRHEAFYFIRLREMQELHNQLAQREKELLDEKNEKNDEEQETGADEGEFERDGGYVYGGGEDKGEDEGEDDGEEDGEDEREDDGEEDGEEEGEEEGEEDGEEEGEEDGEDDSEEEFEDYDYKNMFREMQELHNQLAQRERELLEDMEREEKGRRATASKFTEIVNELKQVKKSLREMEKDNKKLKEENDKLVKEKDTLIKENGSHEKDLNHLMEALESSNKKVKSYEARHKDLTGLIKAVSDYMEEPENPLKKRKLGF